MSQRLSRTQKRWASTRLSQCERLIVEKLHNDLHVVSHDEALEAVRLCQAACRAFLEEPAAVEKTELASSGCWAVLLAQAVAAQRPGGWVVDSADAAAAWDVRLLHKHLCNFKGEKFLGDGENVLLGRERG